MASSVAATSASSGSSTSSFSALRARSAASAGTASSNCLGAASCNTEIDHFWRAGARAGFAFGATGNWLIYGMGGFARANVKTQLLVAGVETDAAEHPSPGWYAGGGIETAWTPNFIVGVEGYRVSLGSERHGSGMATTRDVSLDFSVIQARATWKLRLRCRRRLLSGVRQRVLHAAAVLRSNRRL